MPNAIKYSTTGDTLSLKEGNIFFGVGDVGKGPSSATTYYNGVTPPSGGYTVYSYNVNQTSKLSFFTAVDGASLITYTNQISGQNFSTATQCLNWYPTQTNFTCVNRDYESIITSGLTLCLDAGFTPSYSTSGVSWYDISYGGNNGTLTNGPTFDSSNGGSLVFDGTNDYANFGNQSLGLDLISKSFSAWVYLGSTLSNPTGIIDKDFDTSPGVYGGWGFWVGSDRKLWWWNTANQDIRDTGLTTIGTNVWCNIAVTYNVSTKTASFYINGTLNSSASNSNINEQSSSTQPLNIGTIRSATGNFLNGRISSVLAYNRVLSATEVLQNFNAQKSRFGL
jgi:hypothetical protein